MFVCDTEENFYNLSYLRKLTIRMEDVPEDIREFFANRGNGQAVPASALGVVVGYFGASEEPVELSELLPLHQLEKVRDTILAKAGGVLQIIGGVV